jgi:AraC-like DNA-binding protein
MARPSVEPPSASLLVPAIARYARGRGADVELLACRFGLPADVCDRDEVQSAMATPNDLFESLARALGEPDVALRVGAAMPTRRYPLGDLAAGASSTLRDALGRLARYATLLHPAFEAAVEEHEGAARWRLATPGHARGVGRFLHELALAHALTRCREGTGDALPVTRAWFAHARPSELAPLHDFFGTRELSFGDVDSGFELERALLDHPMRGDDPRMLATVEPLAESELRRLPRSTTPLGARVAAHLESALPGGADIELVARAMHMSERTLQRRLEQEGTNFSDVLDRVRLEVAQRRLGDPTASLAEVAADLGFSDLATFSRAFKRWTGEPPGQWRRAARPPAPR